MCANEGLASHRAGIVNDVPYDYGEALANPNIEIGPPNSDGVSDGLLLVDRECSTFP